MIFYDKWFKEDLLNENKNGGYKTLFDEETGRYFLFKKEKPLNYVVIKSWNLEIDVKKSIKSELAIFILKNKFRLELKEDKNE